MQKGKYKHLDWGDTGNFIVVFNGYHNVLGTIFKPGVHQMFPGETLTRFRATVVNHDLKAATNAQFPDGTKVKVMGYVFAGEYDTVDQALEALSNRPEGRKKLFGMF